MIDPCSLPETGWGWLALVTVSLTLLGLGVAFVALPRRSWMALVGAAAMAVVGIGGASSVEAQTEDECYSIKVVNMGSGIFDFDLAGRTLVPNRGMMKVCEVDPAWVPNVAPVGFPPQASDNCVEFPTGTEVGDYKYLELSSVLSAVTAVQIADQLYTGIGLYGVEPAADQGSSLNGAEVSWFDCGGAGNSDGYQIGNGDSVWVLSSTDC